jgi:hypothetical protein
MVAIRIAAGPGPKCNMARGVNVICNRVSEEEMRRLFFRVILSFALAYFIFSSRCLQHIMPQTHVGVLKLTLAYFYLPVKSCLLISKCTFPLLLVVGVLTYT